MIPTRSGSKSSSPASASASRAAAERDQDVALELARLLRRGDRGRVEVLDLAGDPHREVARVEGLDQVDAALAGERRAPRRRHVEAERRDRPDAGDRYPFALIAHRASLVIRFGHARRERDPIPRSRSRRWRPSSCASCPQGDGWQYEPKWDGFRGVLENVGGELALWSRNARPLLRYFPELRPLGELLPPRSALDGEIVIVRDGALDFDAMQMRLHPAESRIRKLSAEIPAEFVAFDLLLWDGEPVWERPLEERRARARAGRAGGFRLSPCTSDLDEARGWLDRFEALGLDGVVAKSPALPYLPGSRDGIVKVKEHKTRRLRRRRRPLEGLAGRDRDAAARPLPRRRRLDYVGSCAVAASRRAEVARACCRCSSRRQTQRFSEPNRWGSGELEEACGAAGARRRGALRQGAGQPLPPRHEVAPLARRQGPARLHLARAAPAARPERARASSRCFA